MEAVLVTLGFVVVGAFEGRRLLRQGQRREAIVALLFLLLAYIPALLLALGVRLPYISTAITNLVRRLLK